MKAYLKIYGANYFAGNTLTTGVEKMTPLLSADFSIKRDTSQRFYPVFDQEVIRPAVTAYQITKKVDQDSAYFAREAVTGHFIPSLEVRFVHLLGQTQPYLSVRLEEVLVIGYELNYQGKEDPVEVITFSFKRFEITSTPQEKNSEESSPVTMGYDLESATPF